MSDVECVLTPGYPWLHLVSGDSRGSNKSSFISELLLPCTTRGKMVVMMTMRLLLLCGVGRGLLPVLQPITRATEPVQTDDTSLLSLTKRSAATAAVMSIIDL